MTKAELLREQKRQERLKAERERLETMKEYEYHLKSNFPENKILQNSI